MIRVFSLILFVCLLQSCTQRKRLLDQSLDSAGENRAELQKVLDHYSKYEMDSLKLKAAIFLIENMPYHYCYKGAKTDTFNTVFREFDRLKYSQTEVTENESTALIKSALKQVDSLNLKDRLVSDAKLVSALYLIENIDLAFSAWESSPWYKALSFDDFCEYVLPYRVRKEEPEYWRRYLYSKFENERGLISGNNSIDSVFNYYIPKYYDIRGSDFTCYYPYDMNFSQLDATRAGECLDRCAYQIYFTRAAAVPATFDNIPNWGNRPFAFHAMVGNAMRNKQMNNLITNENKPIDESNTVSNASPIPMPHHFTQDEIPAEYYVQYVKTVPKVYRSTWSLQPDMLDIYNRVPADQIYRKFMRLNMKDVSEQYLETADVTLTLDRKYDAFKLVYLAVFDPKGWTPIAYAIPDEERNVCFEKLGKEILYIPVVCKQKRLYAIDDPFILQSDGTLQTIVAGTSKMQDMRLVRKFPLFSYTANHSFWTRGICFEGANKADFSDAQLLHKVDYYPFFMTEAEISNPNKFRYLRCKPQPGAKVDIAELAFLGVQQTDTVLLTGKLFSVYSDSVSMLKAMDGDILTYFRGRKRNDCLCLDLGDNGAAQVTKIKFCPRNDANSVIPGNHYQLYYWKDGWQSLGEKRADAYELTYENVPAHGLYWLRCREGGKEERIFTYENGVQKWW